MTRGLVLLLVLAACSPEPAPTPAKPKAVVTSPYPVYRVAVAKDGLLLTDPAGGAAKPATFGLRQSLLIAILARSFGPASEGRDTGCAYDFARWGNGLTLWFDAGSFVGWSLAGDDPTIGVAPGLVRAGKMTAGRLCELPG
jgi:hypothetical protein